jgi:hypothetical protein
MYILSLGEVHFIDTLYPPFTPPKGMYMPWAYDMEHLAKRNGQAMRSMLMEIDQSYCQCPFGAAGKEVGYEELHEQDIRFQS